MRKIRFYSQSEETDEDGFFFQGKEAIEAELRALKAAPEDEKISIVQIEPLDRDEAEVEAFVTQAFEEWARKEEIIIR